MPLENSAQTAQDPSASAPLAESGERTAGEVAGKAETREGKALNALKKAQAEGNKAEHEGNQAEHEGNKAETKAPPSFRSTNIPGEAVIVTIVPKQFTMTTTKLWSAMKATIAERAVKGAKIKSNTRYRYFEAFKKSTGPEEYSKLFLEDEAEKDTSSKPGEEPLSLENSVKNAQDPSASVPLAETGEGTAGAGAGKPETREEKALSALKEAEAEGNKADTQGNKADIQGNKADTKTKKAEPKAPPSFRSTSIPGEAVVVKIIPQEFTMTTNTS